MQAEDSGKERIVDQAGIAKRKLTELAPVCPLRPMNSHIALSKNLMGIRQEHAASHRQLYRSIAAVEELHAEFLFQIVNLLAERRLGHRETLGCAAKIKLLGHRHKVAQMSKLHKNDTPFVSESNERDIGHMSLFIIS